MFEVITQSQPLDCQSLEILKEAYSKLGRQKEVVATSKKIAEAYVNLGQLSSAILEYESILQRFPDDPDVQAALTQIEDKATNIVAPRPANESTVPEPAAKPVHGASVKAAIGSRATAGEMDDGRKAMQAIFVDGKHVGLDTFDRWWPVPNLQETPRH